MPMQPGTEEEVLDLILREEACRRARGYPEHVVRSASFEVRNAVADGMEFVGCLGGLQWTPEDGWE